MPGGQPASRRSGTTPSFPQCPIFLRGETMTRYRSIGDGPAKNKRSRLLWLLLLLLPAGLLWKEYPSLVRYMKIARM
jgi:hypothetical protein